MSPANFTISLSHPTEVTMTTQVPQSLSKKDRDELVDFSIHLGQTCWEAYCLSNSGFVRVFSLPSTTVRRRANELFQLGFSARMLMYPPVGDSDAVTEQAAWNDYLGSAAGKIVLDGTAYPDTPSIVLNNAKLFFLEGFRAGSIAVQQIFEWQSTAKP
jgi:hypothetical protein